MNERFACGCEWSYGQFFPCDAHRDSRCEVCGLLVQDCCCRPEGTLDGEELADKLNFDLHPEGNQ